MTPIYNIKYVISFKYKNTQVLDTIIADDLYLVDSSYKKVSKQLFELNINDFEFSLKNDSFMIYSKFFYECNNYFFNNDPDSFVRDFDDVVGEETYRCQILYRSSLATSQKNASGKPQ